MFGCTHADTLSIGTKSAYLWHAAAPALRDTGLAMLILLIAAFVTRMVQELHGEYGTSDVLSAYSKGGRPRDIKHSWVLLTHDLIANTS